MNFSGLISVPDFKLASKICVELGGMRLTSVLILTILAMSFTSVNGVGVRAQDLPRAVIAVLDYAKILRASDAAKDVRRQIRQYRESFQAEIQADEIRLREVETDLKRQRHVLSLAAYEKRRQDFREQVIAAQKRGQKQKTQLDQALKGAMDQIQGAVIPIVKTLTETKGFTLVVDKTQVLFANKALDITDDVMLHLNQELRTITVPKPQ